MNVLVVAAHPDDEVLGCGGAIAKHKKRGDTVHVLIVAEGIKSRATCQDNVQEKINGLRESAKKAADILNIDNITMWGLPDNRLDSMDRLDITQKIEQYLKSFDAEIVYVHHSGDVNIDHRIVHEAVVTACRPYPGQRVRKLLSYEVLSSTEWQPPTSNITFKPNYWIDISNHIEDKKLALSEYKEEMRIWPHPRSIRAVECLAALRGSQVGTDAAEAFCVLRWCE